MIHLIENLKSNNENFIFFNYNYNFNIFEKKYNLSI